MARQHIMAGNVWQNTSPLSGTGKRDEEEDLDPNSKA
jgi:hypothetical protein